MKPPVESSNSLERQRKISEKFREAGDSLGKDMIKRIEKNTRKVIQELVGNLQQDLLAIREKQKNFEKVHEDPEPEVTEVVNPVPGPHEDIAHEDIAHEDIAHEELTHEQLEPETHEPDVVSETPIKTEEAPGEEDNLPDWKMIQPMLQSIQEQFESASQEWHLLRTSVEDLQTDAAEGSFENVFGDLFNQDGETPLLNDQELPEQIIVDKLEVTEELIEEKTVEIPEIEDSEEPSAPQEPDSQQPNLEDKLDGLITLVQDHLISKDPSAKRAADLPDGWTHRIAEEVAGRLRKSFPMSADLNIQSTQNSGLDSESPSKPAEAKKISLDDVAAMIDEITGRNS